MTLEDRVARLESEDTARKALEHEYEERLMALEAETFVSLPEPSRNGVHLPAREPIGAEVRTDTRADRLAYIERRLAELNQERGNLVGERERLRGAP